MEPQSQATDGKDAPARRCEACQAENAPSARFCLACGASFSPPPACPACKTDVPKEARFCPSCGLKLVGLRPVREVVDAASPRVEAAPPPIAAAPEAAAESSPISSAAAALPKARPSRGSNIVGNVLLFVAACAVFLVVMYVVNKDAPKEVSPFQGGPAPGQQAREQPREQPAQQPAQPAQQGGAAAGGSIRGTLKIDPSLQATAPSGTVFVILRMAGMPDRGPPVAVKKIDDARFPLSFEIGAGDVMMQGMPFSGPFDVYARLDADGNAMTKAPGDLALTQPKSQVSPGAGEIELVLDKRL
jgi:hypothetical protein